MTQKGTKPRSIYVEDELWDAVAAVARCERRSRTETVCQALTDYLTRYYPGLAAKVQQPVNLTIN